MFMFYDSNVKVNSIVRRRRTIIVTNLAMEFVIFLDYPSKSNSFFLRLQIQNNTTEAYSGTPAYI